MKAHQRYMQSDIEELKQIVKEMSIKLDNVTKTLDNLSGGKQALMWITGVALTVSGLVIAFFNVTKDR
jgi:ABC-type cobalamin/Fe3+-siderophores transport system ATPase subunit